MKKAIIVIDVQNIMFEYEDGVYKKDDILSNIQRVISKGRERDVPIIYVQHNTGLSGILTRDTHEWQIHHAISPEEDDMVIEKNQCNSFSDTGLVDYLIDADISSLVILGMQTEFCVDTSCRAAHTIGFKNILVSDAHSTFNTEVLSAKQIIDHHNSIIDGRFATIKTTKEIINLL